MLFIGISGNVYLLKIKSYVKSLLQAIINTSNKIIISELTYYFIDSQRYESP